MIDRQLGQYQLGIWDFAWSIVTYFSLVQAGLTSSINRYVAMYRAREDTERVNGVINSVACPLCAMGMLVVLLAVASSWGLPYFLPQQLASSLVEARWVVLLLGVSLAVQVAGAVFGGVLTGFHRWDLHNAVYAATYAGILIGSVVILYLDKGLVGLAAVNLGGETMGQVVRWFMARRVYPDLKLRWHYVHWSTARAMLGFGTKTFVPQIGQLLLNQTVNIMIVAHFGPAALALYTRPKALIRHVIALLQKYAFVFTPTASSLQESRNGDDIRELAIQASRYGGYIFWPVFLLLVLSGGDLLHVWMGEPYSNTGLIVLLAVGHLTYIAFMPLLAIISGLNAHGRPGLANFLAACIALVLVHLALTYLNAGLLGVAVAIGLPLTVVNGIYFPFYACKKLDMSVGRFLLHTWSGPIACSLPFGLCLIVGQLFYSHSPGIRLAWGGGVGGVMLFICYWKYVVPENWKKKLAFQPFKALGRRPDWS
jgi:O-antigen/teichoic acid export membrane protein